jgi:hypothetical protein
MAFGPVVENAKNTETKQKAVLNPFKQDPGNGMVVLARTSSSGNNYGTFVPDMAGVSFGNVAQTTSWILTPSCDWDLKNLPGYQALVASVQASDMGKDIKYDDIIANMCEYKVSDFVQSATLVLSNGTMMVETFPELGSADAANPKSYGLVTCGYSNSSAYSGIGIPTGGSTFFLFVNLYYYYDDSMYTGDWPDASSPRPVTSGWMMPRNVVGACSASSRQSTSAAPNKNKDPSGACHLNGHCSKQSFVSGASWNAQCDKNPFVGNPNPPVGGAPYPIVNNKGASGGFNSCLCVGCMGATQDEKLGVNPCVSGFNMGSDANRLSCLLASNDKGPVLGYPYNQAATYPDDPMHVAYTPIGACAADAGSDNAVRPMLSAQFGSSLSGEQTVSQIADTNKNQGGQFITWFDTSGNGAVPIAMQVVGATIFIVA